MGKNITYIFGAGASYEYLPLANELSKDMVELAKKIEDLDLPESAGLRELIDDLFWLSTQADLYGTVDTYARKLSLQSTAAFPDFIKENFKKTDTEPILKRLKKTLFQYFCLKQSKEEIDKRYHKFIASTLDISKPFALGFPPNMTIINWNYDFQFELAYSHYFQGSTSGDIMKMCASYPGMLLPEKKEFSTEDKSSVKDKISIYHLNGTASMIENHGCCKNVTFFESAALKDKLLKMQDLFEGEVKLNFAWEKNAYTENIMHRVEDVARETDVLVVIGYSFPIHNRIIDTRLLELINQKALKIIIVDKNEEVVKHLRLKFNLSDTTTIYHINNCSEFYIPHEL